MSSILTNKSKNLNRIEGRTLDSDFFIIFHIILLLCFFKEKI